MARGTQHRKRRPQATARVVAPAPKARDKKRVKHQRWEDQLFFSRLRVHAKWMFVFLALVFGVGFVIFGVGSGSTGISDVLQNFFNGTSSSGASVSSLQKKANAHPTDPKGWRNLATRAEQKNQNDIAIDALKHYTALRPKDQDALSELAGLDRSRAVQWYTLYTADQTRSQVLAPSPTGQPSSTSDLGKALTSLTNPIQTAVAGVLGTTANDAYQRAQSLLHDRLGVYQKLAGLNPKDALTQLQLAQAATDASDTKTAIAAYKKFLRLAPNDPSAANVRKTLKQLEAQQKATATPPKPHK